MMVPFGNASGPPDPIPPLRLAALGSLFLTRPSLGHYVSTPEELRHFYAPGRRSPMRFQVWKLHAGFWSLLSRARLSLGDRFELAVYLATMMYWDGPTLIRDIDGAMRVVSPVIQFLKEE